MSKASQVKGLIPMLKIINVDVNFCQHQVVIAQWLASRLATREVPGSNPGKGENFSVKISDWIVQI